MKLHALILLVATALPMSASATGLATCDSGDKSTWKSMDDLKDKLSKEGWQVRLVKEDGGCYEVYAIDDKGEKTEAYFHPVSFERIALDDEH